MEYFYDSKTGGFVLNEQTTDESLTTQITVAFIASIMAVPKIVEADRISGSIQGNKPTVVQVQNTMEEISKETPTFGGYTTLDAANILARTIYAESGGEDKLGKTMVAAVIWNRAGGNVQKLIKVCFADSQFSCWNGVDRDTLTPLAYRMKFPEHITVPKVKRSWDDCLSLASELLNGTFKTDVKFNSYYAFNKTTPDWAPYMTGVEDIGNHRFGYLPEHDPNRPKRQQTMAYKVVKGDTVGKIASSFIQAGKTSITDLETLKKQIIAVNKLKNNGNTIFIGQVLRIPRGV